jgi:hypothetical protein
LFFLQVFRHCSQSFRVVFGVTENYVARLASETSDAIFAIGVTVAAIVIVVYTRGAFTFQFV